MLNRLILKVTKFQLPPPKRLGTVVKNILGGHHVSPCQIGLISEEGSDLKRKLQTEGLSLKSWSISLLFKPKTV